MSNDTPIGSIGFTNMAYLVQTAAALALGLGLGEFARFLAAGFALASLLDAAAADLPPVEAWLNLHLSPLVHFPWAKKEHGPFSPLPPLGELGLPRVAERPRGSLRCA